MHSNRLASRIFEPDEVEMVQAVFDRITAQPWFCDEEPHRTEFARYMLQMYSRGLVWPDKLESFCTIGAKKYHAVSSADLKGRRILVVEDDYYVASEAAQKLKALGAIVIGPISNLSDAMDVASHDLELDGALLDVNLNGEMVYPVAGFLKMHEIPFAFLSGYEQRVLPPAFRSSPVFEKPTDWTVIASQVPCRPKPLAA